MFLSEPGRTGYDLTFSLFGFPIRVHPAFFIMPVLFGQGLINSERMNIGVGLIIVGIVFFVSILVHELGHAVAFRYYGIGSRIVLYWMGGLAIPESSGGSWMGRRTGSLNSNQQIVVSLAGPIFGFLLAAALVGIVYLIGSGLSFKESIFPQFKFTPFLDSNPPLTLLLWSGIVINVFLNLLNLVPIYPLDGGQVARQVMLQMDPHDGARNSIYLSIAASVLIAVFAFSMDRRFMAFFFGFMAWSNYQTLQRFNGPRW